MTTTQTSTAENKPPVMLRLGEVYSMIGQAHGANFSGEVTALFDSQIRDGTMVQFMSENKALLATARVRFTNKMVMNEADTCVVILFSDLSFGQKVLKLVEAPEEPLRKTDA